MISEASPGTRSRNNASQPIGRSGSLGYLVRVDVRDSGGFQILSNGVFDEFGYIAVLPFGEIAKLLLDNAGKVNSHKVILNCHQRGFNLGLPGHRGKARVRHNNNHNQTTIFKSPVFFLSGKLPNHQSGFGVFWRQKKIKVSRELFTSWAQRCAGSSVYEV